MIKRRDFLALGAAAPRMGVDRRSLYRAAAPAGDVGARPLGPAPLRLDLGTRPLAVSGLLRLRAGHATVTAAR